LKIVATRLHTTNEDNLLSTTFIYDWCQGVLEYCDILIVVVDTMYLKKINSAKENFGDKIQVFHIDPWISFTQPLNLLIEKALSLNATKILFQSIEVTISTKDIEIIDKKLDKNTLVVGARLGEEHCSHSEKEKLNGWNSPWNTLALWDIEKLGLTGFLTISSGNIEEIPGGIEEVVTISLLQKLHPNTMDAKVVTLESLKWNTKWDSKEREDYHKKKMQSKDERAQVQLKKLGIEPGRVKIEESVC
jgi:hypothetical protein